MSDSETFLSRWLRLKRESEAALPPAETPSPAAAFDPTSLPPIESIVADSDIQQFLREGVPAELTRAALRSAWTADPAIRDFVGIAENQWDFNDHACMPGFGPLEAADYLVAQTLGSLPNVAQESPQDAEVEQPALAGSDPVEAVRRAAAPPIPEETSGGAATAGGGERGGSQRDSGAEAPRSHGGALPQ